MPELEASSSVLHDTLTAEERGLGGEVVGSAYDIGEQTTAILVEKPIETPQPALNMAAFKAGDVQALVYMFNKVLAANRAATNNTPAPSGRKNANKNQGLLNAPEMNKIASISGGMQLNPLRPELKAGSIKELLSLFSMLDRRGVLQQMPSLRQADLSVYRRLSGKGPAPMSRLGFGPYAGRRRQRLGQYAALNDTLQPKPSAGKRLETVFVSGERSRLIDRASMPQPTAPTDMRLAPTLRTQARAPHTYASVEQQRQKLILQAALRNQFEAPRPTRNRRRKLDAPAPMM